MPNAARKVRQSTASDFTWGLLSGLTLGPMWIGTGVLGFFVGRRGPGGLLTAAFGLFIGFMAIVALIVGGSSQSCPSCIDALIVAPFTFVMLLPVLLVGHWLGIRSYRRRTAADPLAGDNP